MDEYPITPEVLEAYARDRERAEIRILKAAMRYFVAVRDGNDSAAIAATLMQACESLNDQLDDARSEGVTITREYKATLSHGGE